MKKFCNTCGNQLELSQRFCGECGAINPFFVPAFTLLSDQSQSLEKLRGEKERIERELIEKEVAQKEFQRQEILRQQIQELDRDKTERLEKEISLREKIEREKIEASIKKEILQVKEEAEQYKKETIDLVQEVRKEVKLEIHEIGEENKRLKLEVGILSRQIPERFEPVNAGVEIKDQTILAARTADKPKSNSNTALIAVLGILLLMGAFLTYFYFTNINSTQTSYLEEPVRSDVKPALVITPKQQIVDTILTGEVLLEKKDTVAIKSLEPLKANNTVALVNTNKRVEVKNAVVINPAFEKMKIKPAITEAKVMVDLNGKKISGCGVIIGSDAELDNVSNLVLVEKSGTYTKYKCTIRLIAGNETYTALPYLYYTDDGAIIKVDGTNCE